MTHEQQHATPEAANLRAFTLPESDESRLRAMFLGAVSTGLLSAPTTFATCTDWSAQVLADQPRPKRYQTVAEMMTTAIDYGNGPTMEELLNLLVLASLGAPIQKPAQDFIARMAATWAAANDGIVEVSA